jgi:hypothetical protein
VTLGPTAPFYAVISAGRFACPLCGYLSLIGQGRGSDSRQWNPIASVLKCTGCGHSFQLGMIAWPISVHRIVNRQKAPLGQRANLAQLAEVRKRMGGFAPTRARRLSEGTNVYVPQECCCAPLPWRQECPVHGQHGHDQLEGESEPSTDEPEEG